MWYAVESTAFKSLLSNNQTETFILSHFLLCRQATAIVSTVSTQMQDEVFSPLKFGTETCEIILHSYMKRRTGPHGTKLDHSKPDHEGPNYGLHHEIIMSRQMRELSINSINWHNLAILSLGTIQTVNLLKYAPDNRSSPVVVTEKWLLKNSKLTISFKNKILAGPQIKHYKKNHQLRLIRPQTQHNNLLTHAFKFLNTISGKNLDLPQRLK